MPTDVLLIRHAETYGNIEGRFCGHSETDLTPRGIAQARALGLRLRGQQFDAAAASDLTRALLTARHALEHHPTPLDPAPDPRLREMHYGEWEGLPASDIAKTQADVLRAFFTGQRQAAPGGETVQQLRERTAAALRDLVDRYQGGRLVVVSHGNAIAALLAELLGMPVERTWAFAVANTSVTRLTFGRSGRVTLGAVNDTAHLEGLDLP
ncbi:histidine phosphatase family protein [Tepidiforma sp.]|uniref:histidine phosphatase family protein n=1 Tax=Tepidiforma sp. TaxID=2682230 RepID=UPI002629C43E|nr:histidine phosphatase family protein [Tepidiforma sp.]MCX7618847.1 histidine phosphatase family protein [Tepidiforma sp.]